MARLTPLWTAPPLTDDAAIADFLGARGVAFERWELPAHVSAIAAQDTVTDADKQALLDAFSAKLAAVADGTPYKSADVVAIRPHLPGVDGALARFDRVHRHDDDEIRAIVGGRGIFGFLDDVGRQYLLLIEAGEYISVPAGAWHWFYCDDTKNITALRIFKDAAGWVAHYRDEAAAGGSPGVSAGGGVPGLDAATRELRRGLMRLGQRYDARGWLFGTCGNLSGRDGDRITITASGRHKGELGEDDFVTVDLGGALVAGPPGGRPSAETSIHLALYEAVATARVIVHVHTVASSLVRGEAPADAALQHAAGVVGELRFEGLEMVKGWDLWSPEARPVMPVFENHADVPAIARDVGRYYAAAPREVPALLIAGHGLTAWGASLFEANRHLEVAEFLCQVALANARR